MGCLFEILVLPFEFIFEFIFGNWFDAMSWIVPNNSGSKIKKLFLKGLIVIECCAFAVISLIGLLTAIFTDLTIFDLWKLIFIPLGISIAQILIGAVVKASNKKNNSDS